MVAICRRPIEVVVKVEGRGAMEVGDPPPPPVAGEGEAPSSDDLSPLSLSGATGFEETPTADELVLRHLLPRLRGFHCPDGDVPAIGVKDDPHAAEAPRDLIARHGGRADRRRGEAFYFAPRWRRRRGRHRHRHVHRTVAGAGGGLWKHSRTSAGESVTFLGGVVPWRATCYCFYERGGGGGVGIRSTGWGVLEYEITKPGVYRRADEEEDEEDEYWVLCHVRKVTGRKRKRKRRDGEPVAAAGVAAGGEFKSSAAADGLRGN